LDEKTITTPQRLKITFNEAPQNYSQLFKLKQQ